MKYPKRLMTLMPCCSLALATSVKDYPEDARLVWFADVNWPVDGNLSRSW